MVQTSHASILLPDMRQFLLGKWEFTRTIQQAEIEAERTTGTAIFSEAGEHLHYREDLERTLPSGQTVRAYREYLYEIEVQQMTLYHCNNGIKGAHFMNFPFDGLLAEGSHLCGRDVYQGKFEVNQPGFTISYRVEGLSKNYLMTTRYNR